MYRTLAIITSGLYTFYPLFEVQKRFSRGFFLKILALCMVSIQERFLIKSGSKWQAYCTGFELPVTIFPNFDVLCFLLLLAPQDLGHFIVINRTSITYNEFQTDLLIEILLSTCKVASQWKMDGNKRKLKCFYSIYSIFAKNHNSHGHFQCIKKQKIIPRSFCTSAIIMLLSP